jgi:hypothetical protein
MSVSVFERSERVVCVCRVVVVKVQSSQWCCSISFASSSKSPLSCCFAINVAKTRVFCIMSKLFPNAAGGDDDDDNMFSGSG